MKIKYIDKAVKLLQSGECVGIPTETVYGLAADAANPTAIKKIFKLKGRPQNHPLILHIYNLDQLKDWVEFIPETAKKLMKKFWPGPMTLIFPVKKDILKKPYVKTITGNQNTIGIRMPSHPITRKLLKLLGGPVVAPSANKFGHVSPTSAEHVKSEFKHKLKLILDGGQTKLGIESTIINVTEVPPRVLRPGPLSIAKIKKLSGVNVVSGKSKKSPRVSGSLKSHYAPRTPVKLFTGKIKSPKKNIGVVSMSLPTLRITEWIVMPDEPAKYAKKLYAVLRELDAKRLNAIHIELPPNKPEWAAIRDRLLRAAG
ncbi:MAG: L-threonylcarbamoyladenylate synthase [Gammaproteobacteria bacterium]|nr:L-threonylcarbamoyladenylate synthase [Gammaproteobacteria bacterium]